MTSPYAPVLFLLVRFFCFWCPFDWINTANSLPWMTGTSINPLLRAAFLARGRDANMVTLMVPFVATEDQPKVRAFVATVLVAQVICF